MGYFDQRTGTWNEGMPPGMESLDLATEYARPLNVAFNEAYSTPYSNYPDPNIAVPQQTMSQFYQQNQPEQPPTQYDMPDHVLRNLDERHPINVPFISDQQRQQQAYDYRMSQPKTANYVRNNTTGAVQDLPSYQPQPQARPTGQVSGAQATGDMVNNLINLGQRQNIPRDQLAAMVQYQASAQPGSPSAEDLYRQSFQYGTPIKDLIAAHSAIGSGSAAREKDQLGLMKTRAELAQLQAKPTTPEQAQEMERHKALGKQQGEMAGFNAQAQQGATGANAIAGLPPVIQDQVKALAEGRMAFPSGFALKSPYWQQMLQAVSQYDPNFDAINYNARLKTRQDFTSGKSAENIKSLNTAIGHLSTITEKFNELENSRFPSWNTMANWAGEKSGNEKIQAAVGGFDTAKLAVSGEMAKVFRSVGMSQQEIEHWMDRLSSSQSPADFKSTMKTATDLMGGRLDAIGDQYTKGMGKSTQGLDLLSPDAKKQFQKIQSSVDTPGGTSTSVTLPNGQVKVFPSGAAAQAFRMETGLK